MLGKSASRGTLALGVRTFAMAFRVGRDWVTRCACTGFGASRFATICGCGLRCGASFGVATGFAAGGSTLATFGGGGGSGIGADVRVGGVAFATCFGANA